MIERGKTVTYQHINENKKVRAKKLGEDYEKETLIHGFERHLEPTENRNEPSTTESRAVDAGYPALDPSIDRDPELQRSDAATEKLGKSQSGEQFTGDSRRDPFSPEQLQQHLEKLRNHTDQLQRDSSKAVRRVLDPIEKDLKQPLNEKQNRDREDPARNEPEQPTIKRDQPNHTETMDQVFKQLNAEIKRTNQKLTARTVLTNLYASVPTGIVVVALMWY